MSRQSELAQLGRVFDNSALSNRNLIINGAMQVAQRGATGTHTGLGTEVILSADRWNANIDGGGANVSVDISADAPAGFANSLEVSPDAAVPTLSSGNRLILKQKIEGQNLAQWAYATSSANPMTLSFWVKSNVTGNVGLMLSTAEMCGQTFAINSSGVWEYKTITFPANTAGTAITYDSTTGASLLMWLAAGPAFQGTYAGDGVWTSDSATSYTQASNINLYSSTSNYLRITGVQLEVGDTATPFEHRSYGQELALCQRYAYVYTAGADDRWTVYLSNGGYSAGHHMPFPVTMRATPTGSLLTAPSLLRVRDVTDGIVYDATATTLTVGSNIPHKWNPAVDVSNANARMILAFGFVGLFDAEL